MNKVGNIFFFRTEGGTSNSAKSHCKTKIQYSAGKVYSVQLSYCNLASSGFWGRHSGRLAFPTSPRFISESRS